MINKRHKELSKMFLKMSKSLMVEGISGDDNQIRTAATIMALLSTLIENSESMARFAYLAELFSASRMIESLLEGDSEFSKQLRDYLAETMNNFTNGDDEDE